MQAIILIYNLCPKFYFKKINQKILKPWQKTFTYIQYDKNLNFAVKMSITFPCIQTYASALPCLGLSVAKRLLYFLQRNNELYKSQVLSK